MVSSPEIKNIFVFASPKSDAYPSLSRPTEGRFANVTNAGRDAVDAAASGERMRAGRMMLMRTAKSCGSDAPMLASSLREEVQMTVSNKPGHRGEREVSRKTIVRGMPGLLRCTCGDYTRVLTTHCTRGCGCIGHPAFPAPSVFRAKRFCKTSGDQRRGNAKLRLLAVIARSGATKQSILPLRGVMDCFAEPVIGRAFARPVGSQ